MIPRCNRCSRLACWWGYRDQKTGWVGWCRICNAKWHWSEDAGPRIAELAIKKLVRPYDSVAGIIYGYVAGDLAIIIERLQREAQLSAWQYFLVECPVLQWRDTRFGRLVVDFDTSDEEEAHDCEIVPNFVNPMHTLMWSYGYDRRGDQYEMPKAFRVMIEFLGAPDFKCMFHS